MNICKFIMKNRKIITVGLMSAAGLILSTTSVVKASKNVNVNTVVDADSIIKSFNEVMGVKVMEKASTVASEVVDSSGVIKCGLRMIESGLKHITTIDMDTYISIAGGLAAFAFLKKFFKSDAKVNKNYIPVYAIGTGLIVFTTNFIGKREM